MIEGHGDDIYRYGDRVRHNFSSNILQNVGHTSLMSHLAARPELLTSYPEPEPRSVETLIERMECLPEGAVMVTAGATDAIYLIARAYSGCRSSVARKTFSEYADACRMHGHRFTDASKADLIWICNPNNPDGRVTPRQEILSMLSGRPDALFILDHAYADYTTVPLLTPAEAGGAGNVLMLNSLTKRFSVPGLRIGYITGAPALLAPLRRLRMPWSVGAVSIAAALYLLEHRDDYPIDAAGLHGEAMRVAGDLRRLGFAVSPTDCNFLLATMPRGTSAGLKEWLVARHGLLVRDASNITGCERDIRIAVQSPRENDMLIKAIEEWMSL